MSDLDAKLKEELRVEFQRLHRELDTTFVYVTHDQNEAMTMSDKIAVMRSGTVDQFAAPETIFHDPVSEHVATFIGTPSTNVLDCEVDGDEARTESVAIPLPESAHNEDRVRFGIRPQYLSVSGGDVEFEVVVDVIEPLGIDYVVHATTVEGNKEINIVTEKVSDLDPGDIITVGTSFDQVYLFTTGGKRIQTPSHQQTEV